VTAQQQARTRQRTRAASDDPLALDRQVCFALAVANRAVLDVYRPLLEPMGLTHPQYLVMLALWERSPRSVKNLGEVLRLDSGTLSPLLKRLAASGLVTRTRDPQDERSLEVGLTDQGRRLRRRAERVPAQVMDRLGVGEAALQTLHRALTRVIDAAG
jgi:MarR family transcriptional regulator, organic hydroperoxide resistance regulator